jgi:hypothetical protein
MGDPTHLSRTSLGRHARRVVEKQGATKELLDAPAVPCPEPRRIARTKPKRKEEAMSVLNNPLCVEMMLDEQKVQPREMEMAHAREALRASASRRSSRRFAMLGRIHHFLMATLQRPPRATNAETDASQNLVSLAVGAVILLSACSSGGASVVPIEASGSPTAEISDAPTNTAAPSAAIAAANCAKSDEPGQVTVQIKPH